MGACACKDALGTAEVFVNLKVAIVGVRGHLRAATEQKNEDTWEDPFEEQTEGRSAERMGGHGSKPKKRFCVVKAVGRAGELYTTKGVEGTWESVWMEEAEIYCSKACALEFQVRAEGKCLGVARPDASAFEQGFNGEVKLEETCHDVEAYIRLKIGTCEDGYPVGLAPQFAVSLSREPGSPLGLDVDAADAVTVRVKGVLEGPFQAYNDSADFRHSVRAGDFIMRANQVTGSSSEIMREMRAAEALELTVRRAEEFGAVLKRSDTRGPLGLEILTNHDCDELIVTRVTKGAVQDWNASNANRRLCKGVRIVAVCGKRGTATELQRELGSAQQAQLTVVRPARPESWQYA